MKGITRLGSTVLALVWGACLAVPSTAGQPPRARPSIVFTQLPAGSSAKSGKSARLVLLRPDGSLRVLSTGFHSAADAEVSFDGKRILFAGKKQASDHWQIFEMRVDGTGVRQITRQPGDCRNPIYQSQIYIITAEHPWHQIAYVGYRGGVPALYSCQFDGSGARRLTYNPFGDRDPHMLPDGRIVFASNQRDRLEPDAIDREVLSGVNLDGTDFAIFSGDEGAPIKRMPCVTSKQLVVFVESGKPSPDGSGQLASVSLRRNLHSHRVLTRPAEGLFHSPSPLPDGEILVSRRPANGAGTYGIFRFDPDTGRTIRLHDDPARHDIQARALAPRPEPDGRASVVDDREPTARFYCLNAHVTDLKNRDWLPPGSVKRLRVVEGVSGEPAGPSLADGFFGPSVPAPGLSQRILGEINVEDDGSFNIQVPANTPIQFQALDADGVTLRTCKWVWAKNKEARGCIGCHEDGELTPQNVLPQAITRPSVPLTLPPERRRAVDFERDIRPLLSGKCASPVCHFGAVPPRLDNRADLAKLVVPGRSRVSPLVWSLFGSVTARPWDGPQPARKVRPMPPPGSPPLTDDERRTILEWIDLGALFGGLQ
jgi:Hydrazine synthase alpha subunit middle domain